MRRFVLVAATILCAHAAAQVPRLNQKIEISIVNVDVFVTDKAGQRVHGLTKDDFEIFEDGKLQTITNFTEYAGPGAAAEAAAGTQQQPQKRTIILFVDRFSLPPFRTGPMFKAVRSFFHDVVRPGDAVTIISWRQQPITRLA